MSLCVECGLCCDGTVFREVPLEGDEPDDLIAKLRLAPDGATFFLKCTQLHGAVCQAYAIRPNPCRMYRCPVLHAVQVGDASIEEGRRTMASVFGRRKLLAEALGVPDSGEVLEQAKAAVAAGTASPLVIQRTSALQSDVDRLQQPVPELDEEGLAPS